MEIVVVSILLGVLVVILGAGYYSFYLTTMVKRRSDAELFALYPGTQQFYEQTPKTSHELTGYDGVHLYGELYQQGQQTTKLVILVHGYKNNRLASLQYIPMFWDLGYDVFVIDQRSHGKSTGRLATYGHREQRDVADWLAYFQDQYHHFGLHGHSMGGATVLALAQQAEVEFIISEAGLTAAAQGVQTYVQNRLHLPNYIGKSMIVITNLYTLLIGQFSLYKTNPGKIAQGSDVPVLAIHGTNDDSVPVWMSEQLIANKQHGENQLWIIPGGNHKDLYQQQPEAYQKVVTKFLRHIDMTK